MSGTLLKVAGVLLAVWLLLSVIGTLLATVKFFLFVGIAAAVVMLVVTLVAKSTKLR